MDTSSRATHPVLATWRRLERFPGGKRLFSRLLGRQVPYTGSIGARIEELEPGYAKVLLKERRAIRNHFNSIHAVALTNLGELASGLAMTLALPSDARGIPISLSIDFRKKARGVITARSRCSAPDTSSAGEHEVHAGLVDESGDEVATFTAVWAVGPKD